MIVGVLLAAAKGVVGATVVTMGLIVLPAMLRYGYDPRLAAGTVAATATLAQIFPPATVLVLLGDQLGNAYQAAQLAKGIFAPRSVTVSDLFAGAIVPGLRSCALYALSDRDGGVVAAVLARDPARPDCAAWLRLARRMIEVLLAPLAADHGRARLDPRRHRDADRSRPRSGRSARSCSRAQARAFWQRSCGPLCTAPRRSPA